MTARELITKLLQKGNLDQDVVIQINLHDGYFHHKDIHSVWPNGHIGYGGPILMAATREDKFVSEKAAKGDE